MRTTIFYLLLSLTLFGCGSPRETELQATARIQAQTAILVSLERDREALISSHEQRLSSYDDVAQIESLKRGHKSDLRRVDEEIGRQREYVEKVKGKLESLTE